MSGARRYREWNAERIAHAALLAGRGLSAAEIAANPRVDSTPAAVAKRLGRLGIGAVQVEDANAIRVPPSAMKAFEDAAKVRQMTLAGIAREALIALGQDKTLLDNVLDDGVTTQ
jgi:predicted secreted protein